MIEKIIMRMKTSKRDKQVKSRLPPPPFTLPRLLPCLRDVDDDDAYLIFVVFSPRGQTDKFLAR